MQALQMLCFLNKIIMEFVSLDTIMNRLLKHPMLEELTMDSVVEYTVDFIKILGLPDTLLEKTAVVDIEEFRGQLPKDYYSMIQVRDLRLRKGAYYRYSTDTFHMSPIKGDSSLTYKIKGMCIYTSVPKTIIEIAYRAMAVDDNGMPLIPDNSSYLRALEAYIKLQYFTILFDMGRLPANIYNNAKQQYAWNVGQAQAEMTMPSIDQMESMSNMWQKYLPEVVENHGSGFKNMSKQEYYKNH